MSLCLHPSCNNPNPTGAKFDFWFSNTPIIFYIIYYFFKINTISHSEKLLMNNEFFIFTISCFYFIWNDYN